MLASDARVLYGYIDEPIEGDNNNLREDFNYYAQRIYSKLNFYFDVETVKEAYPKIYKELCEILSEDINMHTRKSLFFIKIGASADFAVEKAIRNIDPFSDACILSKGNFNNIQKDIVKLALPSMITGSSTGDSYNTLINGDIVCRRHNITRTRYSLERLKAIIEMQKCRNIAKKIKKDKMLIRN